MTATLLLFYVSAALLLQVGVGVGVALWRLRPTGPGLDFGVTDERQPASAGAWSGWRQFLVERRDFEDASCTQCSFHLKPVDGVVLFPFKPGQFLTVRLQVADPAVGQSRAITRCYSLSDRPAPESYRITVKRAAPPPGRPELPTGIASTHLHDHVQKGDIIEIKAPAGQFFLDHDPLIPAVLICGGIGVTPMMSMLRWCLDEQPDRAIHLFQGVRHGREHAFKRPLEALAKSHQNLQLNVAYSRPDPNDIQGHDFQHTGHIDIDLLKRNLPPGRHQFYVCGPPPMMESLVPALRAWGIPEADIHFEAFGPASARSALGTSQDAALVGAAQLDITFRRSGRTLRWDGRDPSLLDFAERHGVAVDAGCRSGSCGSCETKLVSGEVRYARKPDHDVGSGNCLLCVGTPASPLMLDA